MMDTILKIGCHNIIEVQPIAEGGFAYVSLARDVDTYEEFALKRLTCQTREAFLLAQKETDLLVGVCYHYITLCLYKGSFTTASEYCGILRILYRESRALFHLHSQTPPVFHRDIKLENILRSHTGLYKLCDFGSASSTAYDTSTLNRDEIVYLEDTIAQTTTLMYRSPEMVDLYQKQIINDKADIWMLGCVLYTLLFGEHPFQDASVLAISAARVQIAREKVKRAETLMKLVDFMFWMLAHNPNDRPTAERILEVLARYNQTKSIQIPEIVLRTRDCALIEAFQEEIHRRKCLIPVTIKPTSSTTTPGTTNRVISTQSKKHKSVASDYQKKSPSTYPRRTKESPLCPSTSTSPSRVTPPKITTPCQHAPLLILDDLPNTVELNTTTDVGDFEFDPFSKSMEKFNNNNDRTTDFPVLWNTHPTNVESSEDIFGVNHDPFVSKCENKSQDNLFASPESAAFDFSHPFIMQWTHNASSSQKNDDTSYQYKNSTLNNNNIIDPSLLEVSFSSLNSIPTKNNNNNNNNNDIVASPKLKRRNQHKEAAASLPTTP